MITTSIIALLISFCTLLFAYYRYIRNSPKIEIIELSKSSTSSFEDHINDLQFSFKNEVYKEICSTEYLIINRSYRSIELEDIIANNPLEFFIEGDGAFRSAQIMKKVGDSKINLNLKDEKVLPFSIESMDKGSSVRIEILSTGDKYSISGRGKLKKANHSISKIKQLKQELNISETITNFFYNLNQFVRSSVILTPIICLLVVLIDYYDNFPEARIIAPEKYNNQLNLFSKIDSLQSNENAKKISLIIDYKDTSIDTININLESSDWKITWQGKNDKKAVQISDSLKKKGYYVYYQGSYDEKTSYEDQYKLIENNGYRILIKKYNFQYLYEFMGSLIYVIGILYLIFLLIFILGNFSDFRLIYKFRKIITKEEKEGIASDISRNYISKLLFSTLIK